MVGQKPCCVSPAALNIELGHGTEEGLIVGARRERIAVVTGASPWDWGLSGRRALGCG